MSERLVPNELSAVSENERRTPAATPTEDADADASFEFAPATADARAPATPRALSFPDTPVAANDARSHGWIDDDDDDDDDDERRDDARRRRRGPARLARARSLDRWAARARAKLRADAASERIAAPEPAPTAVGVERAVAVRRNRRGGNLLLRMRSPPSRRSRARASMTAVRSRAS